MSDDRPDHKVAGAQYRYWTAPAGDRLNHETVRRLRSFHGGDTETLYCESCDELLHAFMGGYHEQYAAYVRYGPHAICGECIAEAFNLEALPTNQPWWKTP